MIPSLINAYEIFSNDIFIKEVPKNNFLPLKELLDKANFYDRRYINNKTKYENIAWLKNGIGVPIDVDDYRFIFEGETDRKYIINLLPDYYELKHKILLCLGIALSIVIIFKILDSVINWFHIKNQYRRTLHYHLKKSCNPRNFLEPYNKLKIDISSDIYNRILKIPVNDIQALKIIQDEIVERLKINPIDLNELSKLKDKCNPQRFINPFNKEKLDIANECYERLCSPNLTVEDYFEIMEKVKEL